MSLTKKIAMGAGAMTVGLGLLAVLGVGSAVAKSTPTGSVTCTGVSGSITFSPPLTAAGGSTEKATVKVTLTDCTGGSSTPTKGVVSSTIATPSNSCTSLAKAPPTQSETLTTTWSPSSDGKSTAAFGPDTAITSPNVGFKLSGGTVTGSYAMSGASSTILSSETSTALATACSSKAGLKSLTLTSGTSTL